MLKSLSLVIMFLFFISDAVFPQKISGVVFGDYFYMADHHDAAVNGTGGFLLRRVYLTFDQKLNDRLDYRLRFQMKNKGDFSGSHPMELTVKNAFLKLKTEFGDVCLGLTPSPPWIETEQFWNFRFLEKTLMDFQKMGVADLLGITLRRELSADNHFGYMLMAANGNDSKAETDSGKQFSLSVFGEPAHHSLVSAFFNYQKYRQGSGSFTAELFAGIELNTLKLGAQGAYQRYKGFNGDAHLTAASVFAEENLSVSTKLVVRADRAFNPNPNAKNIEYLPVRNDSRFTYLIAGIHFKIYDIIDVMPNVKTILYDSPDTAGNKKPDMLCAVAFNCAF